MGAKYSTQSVSGYNSSPPVDDGTQTGANQVKWSTIKSKLTDPPKTALEAIDAALVSAFDYSVNQKTSAYTTVAGDHMRTVEIAPNVSSGVTISLGDASTMGVGYIVRVKNSGTSTGTIGRATSGNTIDGAAADVILAPGQSLTLGVNSGADGYISLAVVNISPGNHNMRQTLTMTKAESGDKISLTGTNSKFYVYTDPTNTYLVNGASATGNGVTFSANDVSVLISGVIKHTFLATGIVLPTSTPASASAAGVAGTVTWDSSFIYVCVATNTWKRIGIATW